MTGSRTRETRSTCCYCGVGCGVIIESRDGRISGVRGDPEHPANRGRLCTKGESLHRSAGHGGRALYPELRRERGAARRRVSWDHALEHAAQRFGDIVRRHGPDSVAFYISGQLLTEDYYVFNKLAKGLIGTNNVDTNSRLCMSSAVAGYKATLGADAPPACYEDIDHAQLVFIAGSNTAFAHPILFRRIEDARRRNPRQKLIVVDPRRTDTAAAADLHLAIVPGTDVALFNAMLHVMLRDGLWDRDYIRDHTRGFAALRRTVRGCTPEAAAGICGVDAAAIVQAAHWFARSGATLSLYCQGLNQSACGTEKNAALINLHLASGQIGKLGAGPFSLTGQPNAMGGREVGGMANLLSGHRDLANPEHRAEVARLWGVASVPDAPGKTAVELFDALAAGTVKAVWIACTNPAQSMPHQARVRAGLARAQFVVVQDAYACTETTAFADLLLPAASWGEKEGTVTNSERCISRVRAAAAPPGEARPDWEIARDFALRLAPRLGRGDGPRLFGYRSPEQVFDEHRESTRGRDLDITGLSYRLLERIGPQQWPFPEGAEKGCARLYRDGIFSTADGRARFLNARYRPVAEAPDAAYPLRLNTGRLRDQWHSMTRTGTVADLCNHATEPCVAMHPADLEARGLRDGDLVELASRRGSLTLRAAASEDLRPGQAFVPMHWGSRFLSGLGVNALTVPVFDPRSWQPELKHAAVQVCRAHLPWELAAMARGRTLERLERLQPLLARFAYAYCGLFGRQEGAVAFRAASLQPADPGVLAELDAIMGLDRDERCLSFSDAARGIAKRVRLEDGRVAAVRLAGETAAYPWIRELMAEGFPADGLRPWLLAPVAEAPGQPRLRGREVCNCHNVGEREIAAAVRAGASLEQLQSTLGCGTRCGSCLPELKRLVAVGRMAA